MSSAARAMSPWRYRSGWRRARLSPSVRGMEHPAIPLAELPPGSSRALRIAGHAVLLVNHEGTVHAIANECSHAFMPLAGGRVMAGWIACPAHGARFDLATGEALNPPACEKIAVYPVRVEGGMIRVTL